MYSKEKRWNLGGKPQFAVIGNFYMHLLNQCLKKQNNKKTLGSS